MSVFSIFSLITSLLSGNKNIPDTTKNIYNSLDLVLGANHFSYYKKRGGEVNYTQYIKYYYLDKHHCLNLKLWKHKKIINPENSYINFYNPFPNHFEMMKNRKAGEITPFPYGDILNHLKNNLKKKVNPSMGRFKCPWHNTWSLWISWL